MNTITPALWLDTRTALQATVADFTSLLCSVTDPQAHALGTWSIAQTAAHVREVATLNSTWATGGTPPPEFRAVYEMAATVSVDQVNQVNALALESARERDPDVLAGLIQDRIDLMLYLTVGADGSEQVSWLGGLKLPVTAVLAHMLSELLVHGGDIARAEGRTFPITSEQAALLFEEFLVP